MRNIPLGTMMRQEQDRAVRKANRKARKEAASMPALTMSGNDPMTIRVQIPAYTDRWMMGDRYGEVVKTTCNKKPSAAGGFHWSDVHHVKLDKSGRTIRVWADDCEVI